MSSSIPLWVPLVVAAVGVVGTLAASIVTQVLTRRRDDHRWIQERLADEALWERERQERLEQWQREDAARWLGDRRAAYVELLALLGEQASLAFRAWQQRDRPDWVEQGESTRSTLDAIGKAADRAYQSVRLIATPEVATLARDIDLDIALDADYAASPGIQAHRDYEDILTMLEELAEAMREDLDLRS